MRLIERLHGSYGQGSAFLLSFANEYRMNCKTNNYEDIGKNTQKSEKTNFISKTILNTYPPANQMPIPRLLKILSRI